MLGLPDDSVPDDAFMALLVGTDSKAYRVKVQYPNGDPAVGFTVSGITALPTTTLVTNSEGKVLGKSNSNSPTITVAKKYDDVKAASLVVTSTGTITDAVITLEWDDTPILVNTSKEFVVENASDYLTGVDYVLVGGGGGGGSINYFNTDSEGSGGGGGGGYIVRGSTPISKSQSLICTIGSGGSFNATQGSNGNQGGETSISLKNGSSTTLLNKATGGMGGNAPTKYENILETDRYESPKVWISGWNGGEGGAGYKKGGNGGLAYTKNSTDSDGDVSTEGYSIEPTGKSGEPSESVLFHGSTLMLSGGGTGGGGTLWVGGSTQIHGTPGSQNTNPGGGGGGAGHGSGQYTGTNGIAYLSYLH